ncbi:MAG: 50S ribosomal protein L18 [Candidatus Pacearchaeota archaeon]
MIVQKRRRREGKTDYRKRLKLLKSNKHRLVVRKTNRYIIAQIIESKEAKDKVIIGYTTKTLKKLNWNYSFKCLPAAYLLGLLIGKKAKEKGIKEAILDTGLHRITKGNRIFAVVYGASKFINIPCSKYFPSEDRIYGKHINENIETKVKEIEEKLIK